MPPQRACDASTVPHHLIEDHQRHPARREAEAGPPDEDAHLPRGAPRAREEPATHVQGRPTEGQEDKGRLRTAPKTGCRRSQAEEEGEHGEREGVIVRGDQQRTERDSASGNGHPSHLLEGLQRHVRVLLGPETVALETGPLVVEQSPDFAVAEDGTTVGLLDAQFADGRVMRVAPGTPADLDCPSIRLVNRCVVLADLVGDAVLWIGLVPRGPNNTVVLGPIEDLEDGYAIFENGWEIRYPPVIERDCGDEDIPTFSDFIRRFGPNSTSIVDLETQLVTSVRCGAEVRPDAVPDVLDDPFLPVET